MFPNVFVSIPEQPFLFALWIMMCYTLFFVFILELLATLWVFTEFRFRRHRQKIERETQDLELKRLKQQNQTPTRVPAPRHASTPPVPAIRRPGRRGTTSQDDWS